jgi:hypothetical protein
MIAADSLAWLLGAFGDLLSLGQKKAPETEPAL